MGETNHKINLYILAGGKSSRIGKDKGLLELQNKLLVEHVVERLKPAVNKLFIVTSNSEYKKFGYELVEDKIKNAGPSAGIQSALLHTDQKKIFVVSCDMPFVKSAALKYLLSVSETYEITVPMFKEKLEPLFGIYSKSCLPRWEELMQSGTLKLQSLIEQFNFQKIKVDSNPLFDDIMFTNLNTQTDFMNALIRLKHGH